jgi:hypothetical protein
MVSVALIQRHLVNGPETLSELERIVADAIAAKELAPSSLGRDTLLFGAKVTIDRKRLMPEESKRAHGLVNRLTRADLLVFTEPVNVGPMPGLRRAITRPWQRLGISVVFYSDGDQFPIGTDNNLNQRIRVAEEIVQRGWLFFSGARTLPVRLGVHESASDLRIIHEGVHAIAADCRYKSEEPLPEGVTPMYRDLGDATSGCHAINTRHPKLIQLQQLALNLGRSTMPFTLGYTAAILFGYHKEAGSLPVPTRPNPFYHKPEEAAEVAAQETFIARHTREVYTRLLRADGAVGSSFRRVIHEPRTAQTLGSYYPLEQVGRVISIMRRETQKRL